MIESLGADRLVSSSNTNEMIQLISDNKDLTDLIPLQHLASSKPHEPNYSLLRLMWCGDRCAAFSPDLHLCHVLHCCQATHVALVSLVPLVLHPFLYVPGGHQGQQVHLGRDSPRDPVGRVSLYYLREDRR